MENVYSPWAENMFTKEEIRMIARRMGLSVSDKPPLACLASRIPFGERITAERLIRDHNGLARIEVGKEERKIFFDTEVMDKIADELKKLGFKYVTMDLEGYRTGSMLLTIRRSQ